MSTHEVKVIRISEIKEHPNADALQLIPVWGYVCAIKKGQFQVGDLVAYVPPDYEVPLGRPEFAFLSKPEKTREKHRIAVMRLRGVYSQGLLIPAPSGAHEGDNVMEALGITRYEPPEEIAVRGAFAEKGPDFPVPKYELENLKRYNALIHEGEDEVIYTVKIHGTNARYVWHKDRMWCGSHTQWKVRPGTMVDMGNGEMVPVKANAWWTALDQNPWIEEWCRANPDQVLFGEVYGPGVQKGFHYGKKEGQFGCAIFDVLRDGKWVPNVEFHKYEYSTLSFAPTLYVGKHNLETLASLVELTESFNEAGHVREGAVVKLVNERFDYEIGRVALKYVSNQYYEGKKAR